MSEPQNKAILAALKSGRTITPLEALREFNCLRLGARIYDLRRAGYPIINIWETDGDKRWGRYKLAT